MVSTFSHIWSIYKWLQFCLLHFLNFVVFILCSGHELSSNLNLLSSTETDRDHMSVQCLIITLAIRPLTLQVLTLQFSTLVDIQQEIKSLYTDKPLSSCLSVSPCQTEPWSVQSPRSAEAGPCKRWFTPFPKSIHHLSCSSHPVSSQFTAPPRSAIVDRTILHE